MLYIKPLLKYPERWREVKPAKDDLEVSFGVSFFALYIPDVECDNIKGNRKKSPNRTLLSLGKVLGKGQPRVT